MMAGVRHLRAAALHILLPALMLPQLAFAHLMPVGQGTVRLVGNSAYAMISIPTAVLSGADDNGDGLVNLAELNAHRADLGNQVSHLLEFRDGPQEGRLQFEDLLLSDATEQAIKGTDHLVAMRHYQWPASVKSFRLKANVFETNGMHDAQLSVRVLLGTRSEAAILTRHRSEYEFFAGPWRTLSNFIASGAQHILLGVDHLLFLLTVLLVGAGWRYWLAVITSFTVAHSVTLTLAALGWVSAPANIVEPLIAASIVILAIDNLRHGSDAVRRRLPLVFACGLLHGLGIASVLTELGLSTENRVLSLLGFNLGVEFGQIAVVALMLGLLGLARRQLPAYWNARILRACSLLAAVAGTGWMIERTLA